MDRFVQLHLLTSYPPANLNRDDLGRPKTAVMGGVTRLRISSQCLKRNWRTSELFKNRLNDVVSLNLTEGFKAALGDVNIKIHPHIGTRTKDMGIAVYKWLKALDVDEKKAKEWAQAIAEQFGKPQKLSKDKPLQAYQIEQLAHFSPGEIQTIDQLVQRLISGEVESVEGELLRKEHQAVDIAMFGRMLAKKPQYNCEAAVQVAHALTVHEVEVEDDYFTAVDDLNLSPVTGAPDADKGSAHIGETEYGAGLFYIYICFDREDLKRNLTKAGGVDAEALTGKALSALTEAAIKVTPSGKRNSFGHHTYAHYVLAERGSQQPRSLAVSYLKPVDGKGDWLALARRAMQKTCCKMDAVYDPCADDRYELDFANSKSKGRLSELLAFVMGEAEGNFTCNTEDEA